MAFFKNTIFIMALNQLTLDGKAGSTFKELQNFFCGSNGSHAGAKED
jgi:hypothetical protein